MSFSQPFAERLGQNGSKCQQKSQHLKTGRYDFRCNQGMQTHTKQSKKIRVAYCKASAEEQIMSETTAAIPPVIDVDAVPKASKAPRAPRKKAAIVSEANVQGKEQERKQDQDQDQEGGNVITVEVNPKKLGKRSFTVGTVLHEGRETEIKGGKWQSKTPAGAARKAANQACKSLSEGSDEPCKVEITIREVTRNGAQKEYTYEATRKLNEKKVDFAGNEGGVNIGFKYSMQLKSLKKNAAGQTVAIEDVPSDEATVETVV